MYARGSRPSLARLYPLLAALLFSGLLICLILPSRGLCATEGQADKDAAAAGADEEVVDTVMPLITAALMEYFRIYETWPRSWAQLRAEGLIQVDLVADNGNIIDPDDKRLDFSGDIRYIAPKLKKDQPRLLSTRINKLTGRGETTLRAPQVFSRIFKSMQLGYDYNLPSIDDKSRLKLLSMANLMRRGVESFQNVHKRLPADWNELIDSGFCPIDRRSINPVTGQPFYGDGRADDLLYELRQGKGENQSWQLLATDKTGKQIPYQ